MFRKWFVWFGVDFVRVECLVLSGKVEKVFLEFLFYRLVLRFLVLLRIWDIGIFRLLCFKILLVFNDL